MKIIDHFNGTADTIETVLFEYLESNNLPLTKLIGLGTDGAKVLTGRINGVGVRLKRRQPMLTSIHCVCHRLALAAAQAGKPSSTRSSSQRCHSSITSIRIDLSACQAKSNPRASRNPPTLKLKKAADTRWLSHENACHTC